MSNVIAAEGSLAYAFELICLPYYDILSSSSGDGFSSHQRSNLASYFVKFLFANVECEPIGSLLEYRNYLVHSHFSGSVTKWLSLHGRNRLK
jgi:hypothetical protein